MKRGWVLFAATLLLTACGTAATATPTPAAAALGDAYVASDPAAFVASAGQPQLVEFFAFW